MQGQSGILRGLDHGVAVGETIHFALFVASCHHRLDVPRQVSLDGVAQGVKLQADVLAVGIVRLQGEQRRGAGKCKGGSDGGAEEMAAFHRKLTGLA